MKDDKKVEIVKYVPYQLCPKCQGEGTVLNCEQGCTAHGHKPCDICHGAKIIPMAVIPEYTIDLSNQEDK